MKVLNVMAISVFSLVPLMAVGQAIPISAHLNTLDVGANFTLVRANADPGDCGCFNMIGGSTQLIYNREHLGFLLDFGSTHASNINGGNTNLTLTTAMGGTRFTFRPKKKLSYFAQALAGLGHSKSNDTIDASATGLAYAGGGGADLALSRRIALRILQGEYLATRIPNAVNQRQNQLRLSAGFVFRIVKPRE